MAVRACTGVALGALLLSFPAGAAADGEKTPMIGFAITGGEAERSPGDPAGLFGAQLEAAWWHWRLGLAVEGSVRKIVDSDGPRAVTLGASVRLRLFDCLIRSWVEPRDVELGIELQGIVEHAWWENASPELSPNSYGVGLALRLRGGGDEDFSTLLAESRFFVRVMSSRWNELDAVARTTAPTPGDPSRDLTVLIGVGASFGTGTPDYLNRFRWHALGPDSLVPVPAR